MTKQHYMIAAWVGTGIAAIIIITALFGRNRTLQTDYYKELLTAKDQTIQLLQSERLNLQQMHAETLEYARESDRRDSVLMTQIITNQKNYQSINKSYAQIPSYIERLSRNTDSLISAFHNY